MGSSGLNICVSGGPKEDVTIWKWEYKYHHIENVKNVLKKNSLKKQYVWINKMETDCVRVGHSVGSSEPDALFRSKETV